MKLKLLFLVLFMLSLLYSERLLIHKMDGTYLYYEFEDLIDITFDDVENKAIEIHIADGSTVEIALALIVNIEFQQSPEAVMMINKTDGSTYEIETIQIVDLTFIDITSAEEDPELFNSIPFICTGNHPNPFNPETTINFELIESGFAQVEIYNIKGVKIATILNKILEAGSYNVVWEGKDESGRISSSGIYFYKISVNGKHQINKMLLLK